MLRRTSAHLFLLLFVAVACKQPAAKTSGVGDVLHPFIVIDAASGDRYCQICAFGGKPKIVFFADIDDTSIEADLIRIQALVDRHADQGLVAFAVFGEIENQTFTPVTDEHKVIADLEKMQERLHLSYPLTLVPTSYSEKERKGYTAFIDSYSIPTTRRLLFADASNRISFAASIHDETADAEFKELGGELSKL